MNQRGASESQGERERPGPGSRRMRALRDVVAFLGFAVVLFAARSSLADHYQVPTGSMMPTVMVGDRVVVNKLAYGVRVPFTDIALARFGAPARGDVVVLSSPEDGITLLKRVVAVPGDEVAVNLGRLTINGRPVPVVDGPDSIERLGGVVHAVRLTHDGGVDFGPVRVGADQFLVLGDNRGESHDGRAFGLVGRRAIMGRALSVWMRDGHLCWHGL
jgi:signal peptidase I